MNLPKLPKDCEARPVEAIRVTGPNTSRYRVYELMRQIGFTRICGASSELDFDLLFTRKEDE